MSKLIPAKRLPAPRLELKWEQTGETWAERKCVYQLVLPLGKYDIRREGENGKAVRTTWPVEICTTKVTGGRSPLRDDEIDTPYRDGAHAMWDSLALGGLPIYAVCDGMATVVENTAKSEKS